MGDLIFVLATVAFFVICVLYVNWCDHIIGPDNFKADDPSDTSDTSDTMSVTGGSTAVAARSAVDTSNKTGVTA